MTHKLSQVLHGETIEEKKHVLGHTFCVSIYGKDHKYGKCAKMAALSF